MSAIASQVIQTLEAQARHEARTGRPTVHSVRVYGPKIAAMRSLGASYREIGQQMNVSHSTVMMILREWQK